MDKQQAQKIIRDTFENSFDKERFINFIKNFLNSIDESKAFHAHGYVKEGFRGVIKTYERIGTYNSADDKKLDIIIVYLQKGFSLDHARVTQRNFAGRYLVDRGEKDAGLFAFVAPGETDWRFSLVKMDYKFEKTKTGRMKVKEEFTPARRWSFLVGANEKSHTAQSRLVNILANDEQAPILEEIEKAFDIETVTKEFFLKYRELFLRTKEELGRVVKKDPKIKADFDDKGVDTVNFAKKLLGQIVFLYFLQKKGWFGVGREDDWGNGSKHFLRELFKKTHGSYTNFFNDILEPLFYEALRIDRSHDDDYYSRFNCKIPFLNGGLFDPIGNYDWVHTDIIIPDRLFSNTSKTKEGDIGNGILDIFDRFNFTVKEDEPLEKEVAIDPELLGKAYEKFNAIRPDNYAEFRKALKSGRTGDENKFNKKFGVYYTPREIVHYMCQQSLINCLATELNGKVAKKDIETLIHIGEHVSENEARIISKGKETKTYSHKLSESIRNNAELIDRKLADITICDPAVGSGAFPVGMMSEIVRARNVLSTFIQDNTRTPYEFKRRCIEHTLYGVDIDPGAVEIAKLRLWLSLMVDEEDIKNIKPLPNLDYRIMQGNSLISEFMGINFDSDNEVSSTNLMFKDETDELIEHFQQKKDEFLNESNVSRKSKLKEEIDDLLIKIFETKLRTQKAGYFNRLKSIKNKSSSLANKKQKEEFIKDEKEKLYKESDFDLEAAEKQLKEFTGGRKIKPFFLWNLYFSEVFYNKGGFDVVIANPPYVEHKKLKGISSILKKFYSTYSGTADLYVYFYENGIKNLRENGSLMFITSNKFIKTSYGENLRKYFTNFQINEIVDFTEVHVFEALVASCIFSVSKKNNSDNRIKIAFANDSLLDFTGVAEFINTNKFYLNQNNLSGKIWQLENETKLSLKEKFETGSVTMNETGTINIYRGVTTGYNPAFIIDEEKRKELIKKDRKNKAIIKPLLQGRNIRKWNYIKASYYLIFTRRGIQIKVFPSIKKHLQNFKKQLEPGVGRKPGSYNWYEIQDNTAYYPEFEEEKIVWGLTADKWAFAYDNGNHFLPSNGYILTSKEIPVKYLLALMNSKLMEFYFEFIGIMTAGGAFTLKRETVSEFPIKIISKEKQKPFIKIVCNILPLTQSDDYLGNPQKQAKVKSLEAEIDQLVYKLYNLTPEEIKIVEGKNENVD